MPERVVVDLEVAFAAIASDLADDALGDADDARADELALALRLGRALRAARRGLGRRLRAALVGLVLVDGHGLRRGRVRGVAVRGVAVRGVDGLGLAPRLGVGRAPHLVHGHEDRGEALRTAVAHHERHIEREGRGLRLARRSINPEVGGQVRAAVHQCHE